MVFRKVLLFTRVRARECINSLHSPYIPTLMEAYGLA